MKELKKGAQPKKENTQTQLHTSILEIVCLVNFVLFFVLMAIGKSVGNNILMALGAGIGFVTLQVTLFMNGGTDNDQ